MNPETPAFKIKNASPHIFVLHILTTDMAAVTRQLAEKLAQTPDFFTATPIALGLAAIAEHDAIPDFATLTARMRQLGLHPAGVLGGSQAQQEAAMQAGLGLFRESAGRPRLPEPEAVEPPPAAPDAPEPPASGQIEAAEPAAQTWSTLIIDKPVRTGQRIHAAGANLVVLASVNAGAELIADGDIHVYAPLRGRALAGARGDTGARIFTQSMEAELVSVAGNFKVLEDVPAALKGKPAQVRLDGEKVVMQALG